MSLILSVKDESNFKPCPAGSHHATCIRIIDLGTQLVEYQNEQKRQHKILVQWEIDPEGDPEMLMSDGSLPHQPPIHRQPAQQKPTGNRPQKLARKGLYTGRTRQLRLRNILGKPCLLSIAHQESSDGKTTYANISAISNKMKSYTPKQPDNAVFAFDLSDPDWANYGLLNEKLREQIAKSPNVPKP
ncbi:hypothetical protein [Neisseria gonorrhoeae]|uniref:hypothetical protein n=1 Tax=Neisseria gonorrhoeae TaxID=485 RepID=UPI0021A3FB9A|nr:hypothetical protein [Neisseria gonorrhoeae]UWT37928.1 hypothetical protein NDQ65_02415 [Neisseria gonorrhoeae]